VPGEGTTAAHPEHRTVMTPGCRCGHSIRITFVDLHERETFLSFREIHARPGEPRRASARGGLGRRPVALVLPTSPAFMDAYFGCCSPRVAVPLYPPFRLGRLPEYHAGRPG